MSHAQKQVLVLLHDYGFTLVRQRKHLIFRRADGATWTAPDTPNDVRAWKNNLSNLKRFLRGAR